LQPEPTLQPDNLPYREKMRRGFVADGMSITLKSVRIHHGSSGPFRVRHRGPRIDRRHLMRRPMLADPKQADERCDATLREPRDALDRFLVHGRRGHSWPAAAHPWPTSTGIRGPNERHPRADRAHRIEIENQEQMAGL
jgi:hypothetical protein